MNPKIMKLRGELEKNKGKISDLQGRNRELEKQIRELEDTDIIGMVRENGMTMEQFAELFRRKQRRRHTGNKTDRHGHDQRRQPERPHRCGTGQHRVYAAPQRHGGRCDWQGRRLGKNPAACPCGLCVRQLSDRHRRRRQYREHRRHYASV